MNHLKECSVQIIKRMKRGELTPITWCPAHSVEVCGCGQSFKKHQEDYKSWEVEKLAQFVLKDCVMCGDTLPRNEKQIKDLGNFCQRCVAECALNTKTS